MGPLIRVYLTDSDRQTLQALIKKGTHPARVLTRARILLLADRSDGEWRRYGTIAKLLKCCINTVTHICNRYLEHGLESALEERPRPGKTPKITGEIEARLVLLACSQAPDGRTRWTLKLLSEQLVELGLVDSISQTAVYNRLKKNELKPWQVKTWCVPKPSAYFVAKMEDVLDVYARAYDPQHPVVCLDETRKELHGERREGLPALQGHVQKQDYQYNRLGTVSMFMAVEPLAGKRHVWFTDGQTRLEVAQVLRELADVHYPNVERIVLVTDNLKTHDIASLYEAFEPGEAHRLARRFEWHYTPEHGSWLNIAEIELSVLARQCLNQRFADRGKLEAAVAVWAGGRNIAAATVNWQFGTGEARVKLRRLYPRWSPSS
jgi:transposase